MKIKALSLLVFMACSPLLMAQSSMTDQQVLEYVKQGMSEGKDQRQMATELARRGVTREQAERVKKLYEQEQGVSTSKMSGTEQNDLRLRQTVQEENTANMFDGISQLDSLKLSEVNKVFGRNIFNTRNLTFEPSVNLATPPNYRLGPGDEARLFHLSLDKGT